MDIKLVKEIVELTDERNYLRNIFEAAEEEAVDVETIIMNRLDTIQEKLEKLEGKE